MVLENVQERLPGNCRDFALEGCSLQATISCQIQCQEKRAKERERRTKKRESPTGLKVEKNHHLLQELFYFKTQQLWFMIVNIFCAKGLIWGNFPLQGYHFMSRNIFDGHNPWVSGLWGRIIGILLVVKNKAAKFLPCRIPAPVEPHCRKQVFRPDVSSMN